MMFQVFSEGGVARLGHQWLVPIGICFREASDVDLVGGKVVSKEVKFTVARGSIEAGGILEKKPHGIDCLFEG
jgi:hypothetical protein